MIEGPLGFSPGTPQKCHFDCDYQCTHVFILKCRGAPLSCEGVSTPVQNAMPLTKSSACLAWTMFYPVAVHSENNL